ncbi:hypothetical protein VTN00DRAFT_5930 [Thermoascus crustaceus]|uniref:uncharacterized protein n=1 Tax=Thermoascus crustaceus TaxID=5088 RepID=UPI0037430795
MFFFSFPFLGCYSQYLGGNEGSMENDQIDTLLVHFLLSLWRWTGGTFKRSSLLLTHAFTCAVPIHAFSVSHYLRFFIIRAYSDSCIVTATQPWRPDCLLWGAGVSVLTRLIEKYRRGRVWNQFFRLWKNKSQLR